MTDDTPSSSNPKIPGILHGLDSAKLVTRGMNTVPPMGGPPGNRWEPPALAYLARMLPQYEIESLLGAGDWNSL